MEGCHVRRPRTGAGARRMLVRLETTPAEFVTAARTRHVVAPQVLLDLPSAAGRAGLACLVHKLFVRQPRSRAWLPVRTRLNILEGYACSLRVLTVASMGRHNLMEGFERRDACT